MRSGRRPGPTTTRASILSAARSLFSERGFDRTSLRAIAAEAAVDPALISHYFGSKSGLFQAAVELPLDPTVLANVVRSTPRSEIGVVVARFLLTALDNEDVRRRFTSLVRSAAGDPAAADAIRALLRDSVFGPVVSALGMDQAETRVVLAGSQFIGVVMARQIVGIEAMTAIPTSGLIDLVAPTFQRYLAEPLGS